MKLDSVSRKDSAKITRAVLHVSTIRPDELDVLLKLIRLWKPSVQLLIEDVIERTEADITMSHVREQAQKK